MLFLKKKSHQRANRTPGAFTPPGFEVLTSHQAGSPMQFFNDFKYFKIISL